MGPVLSFKYVYLTFILRYLPLFNENWKSFPFFFFYIYRLVFDRDSGKPKGYGFCEYKDQETALSAMRNLNNYEIAGRNLRVDNACTEKSRLEMQCELYIIFKILN